jgi:D-arginine dehydrogenase
LTCDFSILGERTDRASAAYALAASGTVLLSEDEQTTGYYAPGRSAALFTRNYGSRVVQQVKEGKGL